jgi:hypothetical protein
MYQQRLPEIKIYTVKPVIRDHDPWDQEKVAYKTGDILKEVQFI